MKWLAWPDVIIKFLGPTTHKGARIKVSTYKYEGVDLTKIYHRSYKFSLNDEVDRVLKQFISDWNKVRIKAGLQPIDPERLDYYGIHYEDMYLIRFVRKG